MKEYKYLHTFADSSFESDVNGLVRLGWKVIHIEWLIPDVAVFLERNIIQATFSANENTH